MTRVNARKKVNSVWFKHLLQDRDLSQRQLARLMHLDQSSLVRAFQGRRTFKTAETVQLARLLNVPWQDVLKNLDIEAPPTRAGTGGLISVTGSVKSGVVQFGVVSGRRKVSVPPGETADGMQALQLVGEGPFEGAYAYFRPRDDVRVDAIGRLCVCWVPGGEAYLATPRSDGAGTYALRDVMGGLILERTWLDAAAPIAWLKTS